MSTANASLLVVRCHSPEQEPLLDAASLNCQRWCASVAMACSCLIRPSLPSARAWLHPWFSRFHMARLALEEPMARDVTHCLWIDADALLLRESAGPLASWLNRPHSAIPPMLVPSEPLAAELAASTPAAFLVANSPSGKAVLTELDGYLPQLGRPYPNTPGLLKYGFPCSSDRCSSLIGSAGQLDLFRASAPTRLRDDLRLLPRRAMVRSIGGDSCRSNITESEMAAAYLAVVGGADAEDAVAEAEVEAAWRELGISSPISVHISCADVWTRRRWMVWLNDHAPWGRASAPGAAAEASVPAVSASADGECAEGDSDDEAGESIGRSRPPDSALPASTLPASTVPRLLIIVYGDEFASHRTPAFVRTLLSSRSTPLAIYVLGDHAGLAGFSRVWRVHAVETGLVRSGDRLSLFSAEVSPRAAGFLRSIHPSCALRGYDYLFFKLLAPELLPSVDRLIVLDPDTLVLADVAKLWEQFDDFGPAHLLSMAVDQSDRYYYRLQDAADEAFSPGWVGVAHRLGVNGGVLLLHAERARAAGFAAAIARLTHDGAAARADGKLESFCELAEQDTLNLAILRQPAIWRPLDCVWNYMATGLGGHSLRADPHLPITMYDVCADGARGSRGASGDLLRCSCGQRVGLLHFVGGVRGNPLLAELNRTVLEARGAELLRLAELRNERPAAWPQGSAGPA